MSRILDENYYEEGNISYACPSWAPIVGFTGIAFAVVAASEYCQSKTSFAFVFFGA